MLRQVTDHRCPVAQQIGDAESIGRDENMNPLLDLAVSVIECVSYRTFASVGYRLSG